MTFSKGARLAIPVLAVLVLLAAVPQATQARGPLYRTTYPSKVTHKLWSGVSNILFCWVEIPIEINREIQNTDPFSGSLVGLGRGIWFTGRRLGVGVVDAVTCPFDVWSNNYGTVQRTDFPFIDEVE
ncbi:MAG: exosortase system-associated protein, TIGR04073 family [Candidatus Sumerlaeia bacterium]|nr:exosortase system-associated protein, TIGR04073 family [Candidatus Sumerlaeia bacterium]